MKYFWQISQSLTALYGAAVVGFAAALMHLWQGDITSQGLARVLSAIAMLAFHCLALMVLNIQSSQNKLSRLVAILWHLGLICFVWTLLAGVFFLPFYFSQLAPIGGQLLIVAWLLLAFSAWQRS